MFKHIFLATLGFTAGTVAMMVAGFKIAAGVNNITTLIMLISAALINYFSAFMSIKSMIERVVKND